MLKPKEAKAANRGAVADGNRIRASRHTCSASESAPAASIGTQSWRSRPHAAPTAMATVDHLLRIMNYISDMLPASPHLSLAHV
jgi:hypothetical protein